MLDDGIFTIDVSTTESSDVKQMIRKIEAILPDDLITEFDGIVSGEDRLQWTKGDLTNKIWDNVQAKKLRNGKNKRYTFLDICYFVSIRFLKGKRSYNTVKTWALVCRRYSPAVRQAYHYDEVEFSHFAYAAKKIFDIDNPETGQKRWQDVLDYSFNTSKGRGYDVSESELEFVFESKKRPKTQFQPTVNDFSSSEIDVTPIEISQIATVPEQSDTLEIEFSEALHRLAGIVHRIGVKHPIIASSVMTGYSILSNALTTITSRVLDDGS